MTSNYSRLAGTILLLGCINTWATVRYVNIDNTSPASPYLDWGTAATNIQDAIDVAVAGDLVLVTNGIYQTGGKVVTGELVQGTNRVALNKPLTVQSVNGPEATIIKGYQVPGVTNHSHAVRCVFLGNNSLLAGFTLTGGATPSSQPGGGITGPGFGGGFNNVASNCVLVGNAAYSEGGGSYGCTLIDCVIRDNVVLGFTGSGGGASESVLNNCVISNNFAPISGGGVENSELTNCLLVGNSPGGASLSTLVNCSLLRNTSFFGGGAEHATLINCVIADNQADFGGGTSGCRLNNCLVTGNRALTGGGIRVSFATNSTIVGNIADNQGGGAYCLGTLNGQSPVLNNCIVYFNTAPDSPNFTSGGTLNYSCTTPLPTNGIGNISNDPALVNPGTGDMQLQADSPCINSGNNLYSTASTDLNGNPRITGGTVDIGAYEFQQPTSILSYAWLQQYQLPTDGSADYSDTDGDTMNNWQEWRAATIPTDPSSLLKMLGVSNDVSAATVKWTSVNTRTYFLERSTDLTAQPAFVTVATNIAGHSSGTNTFTDTNAVGAGPFFYRTGVH